MLNLAFNIINTPWSYLMNKYIFFGIISVKNKTWLLANVTHGALTCTSLENVDQ